jgi:hypothetical protein
MPRFFFDVREGVRFTPDDEGLEFPGIDAAEHEAAETAAAIGRRFGLLHLNLLLPRAACLTRRPKAESNASHGREHVDLVVTKIDHLRGEDAL